MTVRLSIPMSDPKPHQQPESDDDPAAPETPAPGEAKNGSEAKRGRGRPPGLKNLLTKTFPDGATLKQLRAAGYMGDQQQEEIYLANKVALDERTGVYSFVRPRRGRPPKHQGSMKPHEQPALASKLGDVIEIPIDDIVLGERHRKDLGDIDSLGASIATEGLLQPIGITRQKELVFGYRRTVAVKKLRRKTIPARIVSVTSIAKGEHDENELRKAFTVSERVAILQAIARKPVGHQARSQYLATIDDAAKQAGFSNRETARQATAVIERGEPELVDAMDRGDVSIDAAAVIVKEPPETQKEIAKLPKTARKAAVRSLRNRLIKSSSSDAPPGATSKAVRLVPWDHAANKVAFTKAHWLRDDLRALRDAIDEIINTPVMQ
jgi:ParB-like chromosome segregation protein Spo0J